MMTNFSLPENKYNIDFFLKIIEKDLKEYEFFTFNLGISFPYDITEDEKNTLKKEFQYNLIKDIEKKLNKKRCLDSFGDINILIDYNYNRVEYVIMPIYIYGIYNKYSRDLPQTIDYCFKCKGKGCKQCNFKGIIRNYSLQEIITKYFSEKINFKESKFHGSGREDINVLMLGNGREFILEFENPKNRIINDNILKEIEENINKQEKEKLTVKSLKQVNKEKISEIKNEKHFKEYLAKIECTDKIKESNLKNIILNTEYKIKQFTPKRVSKRRALITRERSAEIIEVKKIDEKHFSLKIKSEAGLYIKEFISGENKKTIPSISEIMDNNCKCTQLEVVWIYR